MAVKSYANTSGQARTWLNLTHPETGQTLHLKPGEKVSLDLGDKFADPHLQPVTAKAPRKRAAKPKSKPKAAPAADTTPTSEEQ